MYRDENRKQIKEIQRHEIETILKEERKEGRFIDLDVNNIDYLIGYKSGKCITFIDAEGDLDWETEGEDFDKSLESVLPEISILQTKPSIRAFGRNIRKDIWILLGNAIILSEDKLHSSELINEAGEYIADKEKVTTRIWILGNILLILAVAFAVSFIFNENKNVSMVLYGVIGSCFSALLNVGTIKVSCSAGRCAVILECILKCVVGMLSSCIVTLALKSGIILSDALNSATGEYFLIILQIAAGFSERLAPSILESVEKRGVT